jgi:hypothetical protein
MPSPRRLVVGILLVFVASGCASSPTQAAVTSESATTSPSTAAPSVTPTPILSGPPSPSAPSPASSPPPSEISTGWTGITWRRLAVDDPLAQFRSVTRWRGGYIARGDARPVEGGEPGALRTLLWTSSDGRSWSPLEAGALGVSTLVVGMAATADGLVALTFDDGSVPQGQDAGEMLKVARPFRSWTSADGRSWTDHPGPDVDLPDEAYLRPDDIDWLQASSTPLLIVAAGSGPPFISTDGITWTREATSGLSTAFPPSSIKAVGSGFVAVSDTAMATSPDGRTWTKHLLSTGCSANEGIVLGRTGYVATGLIETTVSGVQRWVWCESPDDLSWHKLPDLSPLGRMSGEAAQECRDNCPDGSLVGDGQRMVAYRGWGDQAGWTSNDGRTWRPLAFQGHPERSTGWLDDNCTNSLVLMPMGTRCLTNSGASWFGEPSS